MPALPQESGAFEEPALAADDEPKSGHIPTAAIVGAVFGGMLVLLFSAAAVRWYKRRGARDVHTPDNFALSRVPTLAHSPDVSRAPTMSRTSTLAPSTLAPNTPSTLLVPDSSTPKPPNEQAATAAPSTPAPLLPPKDIPNAPPAQRASRIPVLSSQPVCTSDPDPVAPPIPPRPHELPPSYTPT